MIDGDVFVAPLEEPDGLAVEQIDRRNDFHVGCASPLPPFRAMTTAISLSNTAEAF